MYREENTSPQDLIKKSGNSEALSWNLMGKQMGQLYEKNSSHTKNVHCQDLAMIQVHRNITHQLLQISQQFKAGNSLEFAGIILKTVHESTEGKTHTLHTLLILLCKPVCQQRE